jgi:LEA14-like dessication related protein
MHLKSPQLTVVNVQLLRSDILSQRFRVRMRVMNPNDRKLAVAGIDYRLQVEGENFANGTSAASFVVPALGQTEFDMTMNSNMAATVFKLLGQKDRTMADPIAYRIAGKVSLSEGLLRSVPFDQKGTFRLN